MQPHPVSVLCLPRVEGVNGVTGKQECGEISEDCVQLPQEVVLCKEPTPGGKQGPGSLLGQPLSH